MTDVDLQELRVFLVLAEELHFGRAAKRIGLTTSRVSQTIRALERKLGGHPLLQRTSRRVALTPSGTRLRSELLPALNNLDAVVQRARDRAAGPGRLRIGVLNAASSGPTLDRAVREFETVHPDATVDLVPLPFADRLGPLRRHDVDMIVSRLPLEQDDIVVGPVLSHDERVLLVARDHPLATRASVEAEDLADHTVARPPGPPSEMLADLIPTHTPSGRPIAHSDLDIHDTTALLLAVARGRLVHPTVQRFAEHHHHEGILALPIRDLPPSRSALAWLRADRSTTRTAFLKIVRAALAP